MTAGDDPRDETVSEAVKVVDIPAVRVYPRSLNVRQGRQGTPRW